MDASTNTPFFNRLINATLEDMIINGYAKGDAFAFFTSSKRTPSQGLRREIAAHLGDERNVNRIKDSLTRDYIHGS